MAKLRSDPSIPYRALHPNEDRLTSITDLLHKVKRLRPAGTLFPPGHFYSPYPDLGEIERRRDRIFDRSEKRISGIDLEEAAQINLLKLISAEYYAQFPYPQMKGTTGLISRTVLFPIAMR